MCTFSLLSRCSVDDAKRCPEMSIRANKLREPERRECWSEPPEQESKKREPKLSFVLSAAAVPLIPVSRGIRIFHSDHSVCNCRMNIMVPECIP